MLTADELRRIIDMQIEITRQGLDLSGVMAIVVEHALALTAADGLAIELVEGDEMVYRAVSGIAHSQLGLRIPREGSMSGLAVRTGQLQHCHDSETDPHVYREACRRVGLRSMVVLPLTFRQVTVGIMKAMWRSPQAYTETTVELLKLVVEMIASAMYFATRYDADSLYHQATHDSMTGLANRSYFMDRLRSLVDSSVRNRCACAVLVLDMDELKQVNDQYGHRQGDAMIVEFSRRLRASVRQTDLVARIGGDEFALLLSPLASDSNLQAAMHRINGNIERPWRFEGADFAMRGSLGAAHCPDEGVDPAGLLHLADLRMYEAKRARKVAEPNP
ncbi:MULTISPECIES: sensor domain-containing diguanylate cyclase [Azospirillum]|uniref:sensor domain-containing diguanylate cyclase n=1 Tax=Azospirillum TaxID=191 RepID=UPI00137B794A|nr:MULTISPECIES: sensor domain-containing diguanylate cyclase [Azospirillum]